MSNNHENLINSAAKHLGTSPDAIKSAVQSGSVDNLISSMPPGEAEKLKKFLSNKAATEKLLKSPQVQELMSKLMGNKNE